jgi:DNA invertase Pin-like site-specific DNA recombinase
MQQFVIYYRVSTKGQGESGLGLAAQKRDIDLFLTTYAETPFEVAAEFTDIQSGKDNDRVELNKALELCRKIRATLLIAKLDRLSRRVAHVAALLEDPKLTLRVASMPNADKFQLHIYAALAEQERAFISLRTKAALAAAKAKGAVLGGLRDATGKRNDALQAEAQSRAAKVADLVQPLRAAGKTLRQIAEALNASSVPTARGGQWSAAQVMRVIERLEALETSTA